jgi:hypothetical protein
MGVFSSYQRSSLLNRTPKGMKGLTGIPSADGWHLRPVGSAISGSVARSRLFAAGQGAPHAHEDRCPIVPCTPLTLIDVRRVHTDSLGSRLYTQLEPTFAAVGKRELVLEDRGTLSSIERRSLANIGVWSMPGYSSKMDCPISSCAGRRL